VPGGEGQREGFRVMDGGLTGPDADPGNQHVYPCNPAGETAHVTDGSPCWCGPRHEAACPACDGPESPDPACWRCGGEGWVEATGIDGGPFVVIHRG
jgi:hypothetical protein